MGTGGREEVKRGANRFTFFELIIGSLRFRVSLILSCTSPTLFSTAPWKLNSITRNEILPPNLMNLVGTTSSSGHYSSRIPLMLFAYLIFSSTF